MEDSRRCTATSKASGERCGRAAILGGTVCPFHGGSAPQVKAKAKERLKALEGPAITRLESLLKCAHPPTELGAVKAILEVNGHLGNKKLDVTGTITTSGKFDLSKLNDDQLAALNGILAAASIGSEGGDGEAAEAED